MRALTALAEAARHTGRELESWFFAPSDPRAYAALRIGYAAAAFSVLVDYWPLRSSLLTSAGMFGGAEMGGPGNPFNVFYWVRGDTGVSVALVVFAAAMVCLGLGIATRLSAFVTYVWTLSYSATAPVALSGFDTILRVIGFVLVISPSVTTWSLGRRAPESRPAPPAYGLRLVQWQLMLIYVCTAWLKAPDQFWRNGEAVLYFWMSTFARFPTPRIAHFGVTGALATYGTLLVEATVPFLLWGRRTRFFGVLLGAGLHIGIALTSELALFSLSILPLYFAFFESEDFDRIASLFGRAKSVDAGAGLPDRGVSVARPGNDPPGRQEETRAS